VIDPGLCGRCRYARTIRNRRGSIFFLCGLAERDARFPKYPVLPMMRCSGFQSRTAEKQISRTAEQQNSRTAEQQNSRTAEQQNSRTAEQQNSRTAEQQKSEGRTEDGRTS
jgi:hypothetical protein